MLPRKTGDGERNGQMDFCPLFSGSSGNCTYVSCASTALLVDAGLSGKAIVGALDSIGADIGAISAVVVTHEHIDHVKGIGVLSRRYHIPIYCTPGTWRCMPRSVGEIPPPLRREIGDGEDFYIGDLSLTPFPISHDAAQPVGYRIWGGGRSAAVATDMGYMKKETLKTLSGTDLVLIECNHDPDMLMENPHYTAALKARIRGRKGHLSNEDCARAVMDLYDAGTRHVVLGHLSRENNTPEKAHQTVCMAAAARGIVPDSGLTVDLAWRDRVGKVYHL